MGSHLAENLINKGNQVVVLDDLSGGYVENVSPKAEFVLGSITDKNLVNGIFEKNKFDYVFHLAAYAAEGLSPFIKKFNYENNLIGSINLINASVNFGVKRFVFTSSASVYGANQLPMTEDLVPSPEDSYGISKYAVERELETTKKMFGLDYTIFRPHNIYGERQNIWDDYRNVIGIFMLQCMKGEPLRIYGNGNQTRSFTYFSDILDIIADSILDGRFSGETFNVGADEVTSINKLAEMVSKAMGVPLKVNHTEPRYEVTHTYESQEKLKKMTGYEPKILLEEGLIKMAKWAKEKGIRDFKEPKWEGLEIKKNFYSFWNKKNGKNNNNQA